MDNTLFVALAAAVAGAVTGVLLTWWAQHRQEQGKLQRSAHQGFQDKLHQLELRIVALEAKSAAFAVQGRIDVRRSGGEADA